MHQSAAASPSQRRWAIETRRACSASSQQDSNSRLASFSHSTSSLLAAHSHTTLVNAPSSPLRHARASHTDCCRRHGTIPAASYTSRIGAHAAHAHHRRHVRSNASAARGYRGGGACHAEPQVPSRRRRPFGRSGRGVRWSGNRGARGAAKRSRHRSGRAPLWQPVPQLAHGQRRHRPLGVGVAAGAAHEGAERRAHLGGGAEAAGAGGRRAVGRQSIAAEDEE
mmetsp:Transcript_19923/g.47730  ORF Transcript_19923/g.47730 Transcript_19923/m.47730 type:complete len:224 (-) Transcript_19923:566-1237(-)